MPKKRQHLFWLFSESEPPPMCSRKTLRNRRLCNTFTSSVANLIPDTPIIIIPNISDPFILQPCFSTRSAHQVKKKQFPNTNISQILESPQSPRFTFLDSQKCSLTKTKSLDVLTRLLGLVGWSFCGLPLSWCVHETTPVSCGSLKDTYGGVLNSPGCSHMGLFHQRNSARLTFSPCPLGGVPPIRH